MRNFSQALRANSICARISSALAWFVNYEYRFIINGPRSLCASGFMRTIGLLAILTVTGLAAPSSARFTEWQVQTKIGVDSNPVGTGGSSAAVLGDGDSIVYGGSVSFAVPIDVAKLTYAGDATQFSRRASENFITHRFGVSTALTLGDWKLTGVGSSLFVDGSRETLASLATVNANAISLWRERREQWQHRAKLQATRSVGAWLLRGAGSLLDYDYQTRTVPGNVPFANRSDINGTVDVGWKPSASSLIYLGGRAGRQDQEQVPLPNCAFDYSNTYRRVVGGIEAKPSATSTVSFSAGPSFHHYTGDIDPRTFLGGRDRTALWLETTFAFKPYESVSVTGKAVRMPWLSSTGKSAYLDTCAEAAVTWAAAAKTALRVSGKFHRCDYFPVVRDDLESFVGAGLTIDTSRRISLTVDVLRHHGWNSLDGVPERAFNRALLMLGTTVQL